MRWDDFVESVDVLHLEPDDAIVVRFHRHITADQAKQLREQVEATVPGHPVLVLAPGLTVEREVAQ
jgi:hypothetical protein